MHIYRATGFRETRDVPQRFMSQKYKILYLKGLKWYVSKNTSSVIMFTRLLSFCQQNIAKSNGHFSKMDGDVDEDLWVSSFTRLRAGWH